MAFSRTEQSKFNKQLKLDQWGYDFEPYKEDFEEGWEDLQQYSQIPIIGNIAAWTQSGGTTYDQKALEEMGDWQQYDILFGAEEDIIEGYAEAESQMQSDLDKAAIIEGITLIANIVAPGVGEVLDLGGTSSSILRGLISNVPKGGMIWNESQKRLEQMSFLDAMQWDLERLGLKDKEDI